MPPFFARMRSWPWILSLAIHAALAWVLLQSKARSPATEQSAQTEIEFTVSEAAIAEEPSLPNEEPAIEVVDSSDSLPALFDPSVPTVAGEEGVVATGEEPIVLTNPDGSESPTGIGQAPAAVPQTAEERAAFLAMVDPSRVARDAVTDGQRFAPQQHTGRVYGREGSPTTSGLTPLTQMRQELQDDLRRQAMAKTHTARTRPRLVRRTDGTFTYQGHAFGATIRPDGSVAFNDRPGVSTDGVSASGSFDMTDMFMRSRGQDPYAAEREWFMEQTEDLRAGLEAQASRQRMESAVMRLRGRLQRIWSDETKTGAERRASLFDIWDDAADDASGTEVKDLVLRFVRENLPRGSEAGFPDTEVTRLNSRRHSRERFEPYGG